MEKAVAAAKGKVALVKVNIDDGPKLADEHGIEYVPTLLLFNGGKRVSELDGEKMTQKGLREWMEA